METKQKKSFIKLLKRMKKSALKSKTLSVTEKTKEIELIQAMEDAVLKIKPY